MASFHRVTLSVPVALAQQLKFSARRLGVSQSALASSLLVDAVGQVAKLCRSLPVDSKHPTAVERRRLRGASVEVIKHVVSEAVDAAAHLNETLPLGPRRR